MPLSQEAHFGRLLHFPSQTGNPITLKEANPPLCSRLPFPAALTELTGRFMLQDEEKESCFGAMQTPPPQCYPPVVLKRFSCSLNHPTPSFCQYLNLNNNMENDQREIERKREGGHDI